MGPPLGEKDYGRDGIVIDYWLGSTCWMAADPGSWDGPFYDYTEGQCPAGHRQMIDD
jgi:hypothetical protein